MPKMLPYTREDPSGGDVTQYLITNEEGVVLYKILINNTSPFNTSLFDKQLDAERGDRYLYMPEDIAFTISTLILAHMTPKKGQ